MKGTINMEISCMEYDFLVKSIIGQTVVLSGEKYNSNDVIEACIAKADRDMITAGCLYLMPGYKDERRNGLKNLLKKNEYCFSRNLIEQFAKGIMEKEIKDGIHKDVSYGLSQKIINMCFKYFYVFRKYMDLSIDFSNCDCPIDGVILAAIGKNSVWSQIERAEYKTIQDNIDEKIKEKIDGKQEEMNLYCEIGRMLFDFYNW